MHKFLKQHKTQTIAPKSTRKTPQKWAFINDELLHFSVRWEGWRVRVLCPDAVCGFYACVRALHLLYGTRCPHEVLMFCLKFLELQHIYHCSECDPQKMRCWDFDGLMKCAEVDGLFINGLEIEFEIFSSWVLIVENFQAPMFNLDH